MRSDEKEACLRALACGYCMAFWIHFQPAFLASFCWVDEAIRVYMKSPV